MMMLETPVLACMRMKFIVPSEGHPSESINALTNGVNSRRFLSVVPLNFSG
jgi:hypothetical protein